jgi:hypothetical protein
MPTPSKGAVAAAAVISLLGLLMWAAMIATLSDLGHSDAAGNGMAEAFAGIEIVVLWVLLGILLLVTGIAGVMPWPGVIAAVVLLPASGGAALLALDLLSNNDVPPFLWPIVVPVLAPPLVIAFSFWTLLPSLRAIPTRLAVGVAWGATLALCLALWPMQQMRDRYDAHLAALDAKWADDFARLAPDAPLWERTPFLDTRDYTHVDTVLLGIGKLDRRQADAELMLERGDFPLRYLGSMELDPTQEFCDKARALLRRQVPPLILTTANSKPYMDIFSQVEAALSAMRWLSSHGCPCASEAAAWEAMAKNYRDANFDVVELKEMHE